ncbi:MAG: Polyamine-transporting ATPase [Actinomycetia bacterium]|nr:Polyamine-transporting ATPase [Actinomycetes bacterium]
MASVIGDSRQRVNCAGGRLCQLRTLCALCKGRWKKPRCHFTGKVELAGTGISRLPAYERTRLGLARTWQSTELFDDLDVTENLTVATAYTRVRAGPRVVAAYLGDSGSAAAAAAEPVAASGEQGAGSSPT